MQSYKKFRDLQEKRDLYTSPTLLAGSLEAGRQWMVRGNIEPVAQKKYSNLREYLALYPEYSCMYVGDNGQGDVRTAEMMFDEEDEDEGGMIERCYIHQVQPLHRTHTAKEDTRTVSPSSKFFYFSTYVDAAIDAFEHKFISLSGLKAVMVEAGVVAVEGRAAALGWRPRPRRTTLNMAPKEGRTTPGRTTPPRRR